MNIFVTGARGRLASYLVPYLRAKSHQVLTFSRMGSTQHLSLQKFEEMLEKSYPDAVLHLAWSTVPASAEKSPGVECELDLGLLVRMARALLHHKPRHKSPARFVFFSSCSVYGEKTRRGPFTEESKPSPEGWYACGKLSAENILNFFQKTRALPVLILRISNPYGYAQDAKSLQGVIPALIRAAQDKKPFKIWGSQKIVKDFLHVEELASLLNQSLQKNLKGAFNLCSGKQTPLGELISKIGKIFGRIRLNRHPSKAWDIHNGFYSNKKIRQALGWAPRITLDKGLRLILEGSSRSKQKK